MTRESWAMAAPAAAAILAAALIAWFSPFAPGPGFEPSSFGPYMGWLALALGFLTNVYSLRKRFFLQGPGSLRFWKWSHALTGYLFVFAVLAHSNARLGAGALLLLNGLAAGIVAAGVWGGLRQGGIPRVMTRTLLDPVYKTQMQRDVDVLLKEISESLEGASPALRSLYQRHILPAISIKSITAEQHKALLRRLFGPSTADPNAAARDLVALGAKERDLFYDIAARAVDVVEIRKSQTYQRKMNGWLDWHIAMTAGLGVILFFHVLASFYY